MSLRGAEGDVAIQRKRHLSRYTAAMPLLSGLPRRSAPRNDDFKNALSLFFFIVLICLASPLKANDATESRARALYHDLRCMVCGGQSLAESNAELAVGMRQMILERLENGESETEIKAYLTEKYGDEILMAPPVRNDTMFIWLMPPLLLLGGIVVMFSIRRKRHV